MGKGSVLAVSMDKKHQDQLKKSGTIPAHIAIIMDGNGRWAKKRNLPRVAGHNEGVNAVRDIVETSAQLGVKYLTLYTFSTENWRRPKDEVSMLMRLLLTSLKDERDRLNKNNVRLRVIGDIDSLPSSVQDELNDAMELMKQNTGLTLVLALSYSGRWDITQAVKRIATDVKEGTLEADAVNEATISRYLSTHDIPDPDLLVRTSGELRLSNFLLWELAYTEIYITDLNWPDFRHMALYSAIAAYQSRERRFGMVSEQLPSPAKRSATNYVERFFKSVSGF
ncbi:MAG TPA: isoprenyl transferase [Bacteroidota bacterium]|nr:isoprenyl transferase [Bacteroidota bacterium]